MKQKASSGSKLGLYSFKLMGLLLLIASFSAAWLYMDFQAFRGEPLQIPLSGVTLEIRPGEHLKRVANRLDEMGVLSKPLYLVALGRYLQFDSRIKAGEFRLQRGINPQQLLEQLARGQVVQYSLTLIEGETFKEMMVRISEHPVLVKTLTGLDGAAIMNTIGKPDLHPEGRFLPETYYFPRGTSDVEFIRRAFQDMQTFLQQAWKERGPDLPLKTPEDALILASIVEKETGVAAERPLIAGVFIRRLRKGMKLQTDPTVIYGMGDSFDGDIRYRDLRTDTPYNTYTRFGLPPTPIAMPGKEAILAALHPAKGEALFFVARGDGSHRFSSTLKEHNRAVNRYQRKKRGKK
ncbi:FIG004453: protein YceG like [hydrothermal vent metagenome]|uniref:FIG004453: protein YceG like n=1 Tax=hydrothermal vent metagenome TaxID=652676 RepID=A0A3B0ZNA9_9ZZZZ